MLVSLFSVTAYAQSKIVGELICQNTGLTHMGLTGTYSGLNWARVSAVSQFQDENGNFAFAVSRDNDSVTIYKTRYGKITKKLVIANPYDTCGTVLCDDTGNLYIVWGKENEGNDTSVDTLIVNKYAPDGTLLASVGGNGSEGLESYYEERFYTKYPFDAGNCDAAINGNILMINYAREMYSGHQSNTVFAVNIKTMEKLTGFSDYNSHSFDQRVTAYGDGFLLESHGDCFPRTFSTTLTDSTTTINKLNTFNFWVEPDTYTDYNMTQLNKTYARLGNLLATDCGAAFVAASARSLSEAAKTEPKDVFVQVFNPAASSVDESAFVTKGTRTGVAGNNGTTPVTDYGVYWLTDLAGTGKSVDEVQAVSVSGDRIAVLYELYEDGRYDSTWYMLLNGDGSVLKAAETLGCVRLNRSEDPVYAQGAVQWISNPVSSNEFWVYSLPISADGKNDAALYNWGFARFQDIPAESYYTDAAEWAYQNRVTTGISETQFDPDGFCTRAQIVTFLWRAKGCPEPISHECAFSDVMKGSYYEKAVLWAIEKGITKGTGEKTFSPDKIVTRGETVALLARTAGIRDDDASYKHRFSDVSTADYYNNAVAWAVKNGITNGTGGTKFSPQENCLRCQIVTFIYRYFCK